MALIAAYKAYPPNGGSNSVPLGLCARCYPMRHAPPPMQLIHRRFIKTKSIGMQRSRSGESGWLRWIMFRVEMAREVKGRVGIGIGICEKAVFSVLSERPDSGKIA